MQEMGEGDGRRNHHSPESTAHKANAVSSVCAYSLAPPLVLDWLAKKVIYKFHFPQNEPVCSGKKEKVTRRMKLNDKVQDVVPDNTTASSPE